MTHPVDWSDDALDSLALIWLIVGDPIGVTKAQHQIDRLLRANPLLGQLNAEGLWHL